MRREEQHSNQINHLLDHLNSIEAYNRKMVAYRDEKNTNAMKTAYWYNPIKFMAVFDDRRKLTPLIYSVKFDFAMLHDGLMFFSPLMQKINNQAAAKAYSHKFLMSGLNRVTAVCTVYI